jgi:hypothetical protein
MPQLYSFGRYVIYFWVNEGMPTEPVHVHVNEKRPSKDGTKIWISSKGGSLVCHNRSKISERVLHQLCRFVEANSEDIIKRWNQEFGEAMFYC